MRMKRKALAFSIFLPLLLGILLLIGCRPELARSERASDDWSRGQRLGEAIINDRVGFVADRSGQNIYAIWVARRASDSAQELRFVHVDRAGRILGERALEIAVNKPGQVEIVLDGDDHLHLAWVDDVGEGRRLFYAMLDSTGGLLSERKPLSLPQAEVDSYAMGLGPSGNVDLFWSARGEKEGVGLYHTRVGANGERLAENVLLQGSGFDPDAALASGATSGLAGMHERAALLGGRLVIQSAPGAGTCVSVALPAAGRIKSSEEDG